MFRSRLSLLVIAASLLMVRAGAAQTISSSVTFDGSIPPFGYSQSAGLLIVDGSGAPVLTLTNSATTSGIQDIYIGSTSGNTGGIAAYGGSSLVTNGVAILGFNAGSTGSITIAGTSGSGTASQWTGASQLYLGYNGAGYLTITGGGQVTSASTILGEFTNSTGVVTVAGTSVGGTASAWNLGANNLLLGNAASSSGTLTVTGGGQVNAGAISIATNATSTGALTISGPGSTFTVASGFGHGLWVSGTSIGSGGTGSLTVNNGGSLV
ncbi:MAG TPA: hypothetical protein VG713_21725, partial [Pirellulales bacterium]|nr:hypothetical protein [Pirellulales bacterium]